MKNLNTYLNDYAIRLTEDSGYEIARQKGIFYTHTGIVIGVNKYNNIKMVFHNHPDSGPEITTLAQFCNGIQYGYTNRQMDSKDIVLLRSFRQAESGADYKPVGYNCHNASSYSRTGVSTSHGLNNTLGVLALILLIRSAK